MLSYDTKTTMVLGQDRDRKEIGLETCETVFYLSFISIILKLYSFSQSGYKI